MRDLAEIEADINALAAFDFDDANVNADGDERLYLLCQELRHYGPDVAAPLMFALMERLDGADLGDPGPMVHVMEQWPGRYESYLRGSISRRPSLLAIWMVSRIINANVEDGGEWINLLVSILDNPEAGLEAKREVREILRFRNMGDSFH